MTDKINLASEGRLINMAWISHPLLDCLKHSILHKNLASSASPVVSEQWLSPRSCQDAVVKAPRESVLCWLVLPSMSVLPQWGVGEIPSCVFFSSCWVAYYNKKYCTIYLPLKTPEFTQHIQSDWSSWVEMRPLKKRILTPRVFSSPLVSLGAVCNGSSEYDFSMC